VTGRTLDQTQTSQIRIPAHPSISSARWEKSACELARGTTTAAGCLCSACVCGTRFQVLDGLFVFVLSSVAVAALSADDLCVVNRHRVADDVSALTVDFYLTFDLADLGVGDGCADHCGYRKPCSDRGQECSDGS
jgi:hypothetical protein